MYKIVIVGGKLRGQEFVLKPGDNTFGRDSSSDFQIQLDGISKKHVSFTVTDDVIYVQDLGSANGTFLNGRIVKRSATKHGDKIGIPNAILQVVFVKEKKVIVKKKIGASSKEFSVEELLDGGTPPDSIVPKLLWLFKYKLMPIFHNLNKEYEWKYLMGALTFMFAVATITLTISPLLQNSKNILLDEVQIRGEHYAKEIARINAVAIESGQIDKIDTKFLEDSEEGIDSYELFDLQGRIVRPISKLNEITSDTFSVYVKERLKDSTSSKTTITKLLPDNKIGTGRVIMALNSKSGNVEPQGFIAIKFSPRSLATEVTNSRTAYLESLVTSFIVGILVMCIIYYLTLRPLEELRYQIDDALRGKRRSVDSALQFDELVPVRNAVNTLLQRLRELQRDEADIDPNEMENDEGYVNTLKEFLNGASGPAIVLNSAKNLIKINTMAEDLCGIRQSMAEGMNISDVTKERGFAATLIELCDNSANNGGTSQEGNYELQGKQYKVYTTTLMGKDGFAKAYYITFVLDN